VKKISSTQLHPREEADAEDTLDVAFLVKKNGFLYIKNRYLHIITGIDRYHKDYSFNK
jgi:hypothetical protein